MKRNYLIWKGLVLKMNKTMKEMIKILLYLLGVLCLTYFVITFIGQRTRVEGASMEPTLYHGDNLIVDKMTYHFQDPQRFEIIVFPFQYEKNKFYIKRIIGLPGETVQIDSQGNIYINGEILEESYGKEVIRQGNIGIAGEPITLGENEYFVMGDNRNNSSDSRLEIVGNIKRENIVGRVVLRIWPFSRFGVLDDQAQE